MTSAPRATPGGPRDDRGDQRIADAAVERFAEHGWASFSIEAVARSAGVGKALVYLRWRRKDPRCPRNRAPWHTARRTSR
ncbi:helix-turn-helix domain-containing protein [Streptomyces sp. UG1]|uniref:helix-turn-helix domain-containing protein n=1 Tax=Streptomyces sp. UG1 TaxID=3417652 RepID=UPI003CF2D44F